MVQDAEEDHGAHGSFTSEKSAAHPQVPASRVGRFLLKEKRGDYGRGPKLRERERERERDNRQKPIKKEKQAAPHTFGTSLFSFSKLFLFSNLQT